MARCPSNLDKQLRMLKDFYSRTSILVNCDKTKDMIIKSKMIIYATFVYDKNNLEEANSHKYLEVNLHHKLH
jgi:hypothetical protein